MDFLSQPKGSKFLSRRIDRCLRDAAKFQPELETLEERAVPATTIGVNATANVHPISPLIYGAAYASTAQIQDLNLTINRDGGNASDTYNWQADATNHGSDWYYESISSGSGNGQGMDSFVSQAKAGGAAPDLTLDIMPYAANLNSSRNPLGSYPTSVYGPQQSTDPWWPSFGNGVTTSGQKITDTNPLYNYINNTPSFEQAWIQHLISTFGNSQNGGVGFYTFGNEPALWNSTHRDIHPNGETNTELLNDYINYGTMLKALDPNAKIVGPEEWGWTGYLIDGADAAASNWGATYGGLNVEQWFLQQLQQYQAQHGVRLLDYFTNHIYPQASNVFGNAVDQNTALLRNATTRDFWDPNYVDPSWINQPIYLIPRMQSWVNTYYPGTKVGITEYNWGAEGDMNGATAQADIYGIFGAQGLDLGERWTTPSTGSPTYLAMKLWRNYDGSNHGFGDTSVSASVGNPDQVDAFAATRSSDGALTVAVINKNLLSSGASTTITINLSNFNGNGIAQVWQLAGVNGSTTNAAITHLSDISFSGNTITVTVPNESVTMFVVEPASSTSAPVVTTNPTSQTITAGQSVSFVAAATGNPTPTVQWQVSTNSGSTWTNVSGATSTTYTFTTTTSQSGSQYRAVFTNSAGSATTSAAALTVNAAVTAPSITTQPAGQTVNAGQSVSFTVAATGTAPLTYQWQKLSGSTWGNIGTNSATFTVSAAASSDAGSYHVIVSNSAGSVTSSTATLTVNVAPSVTSNPSSQTVTAGQSVSFSAAASGSPPPTVQWQVSTNSGSTFTNISGATGTTYTFTAAATQTGNQFRAVFTNSTGSATTSAAKLTVTTPATGSIAIDAGGGAVGSFVADVDASGGAARSTTAAINTSGVANVAPMAVYQSQRYGNFTYTLPGLTPNAVYTVRLHFAEFIQNGAGKRTFSVAINGTTVLSNFDVFATAGGFEKALVEQFNAKADAGGKITIVFTNGNNNSIVSGIEVAAAKSVLINAGGSASGSFAADGFFSGGTTSSTTAAIDTSLVTNPAPPPVYQTERYGTFTYTITGLTPGANYTVRLDFAEIYWTQVGQRVFNVAINGTQVLTNFDIIAAAGGPNRAIAKTFTATADSSGDITIAFTSVVNYAKISGIEIIPE
jgi:hypothetical protein